jgi:outer membrane protein assembly factor BamB
MATHALGVRRLLILQLLPTLAVCVQKSTSVNTELTSGGSLEEKSNVSVYSVPAERTERTVSLLGVEGVTALGAMNKVGVTRYQNHIFKRTKGKDGQLFWADPANRDGQRYSGATDLAVSLTWGWHHPTGVYNTIPVGSPLIDDELNIYIGADDAIRKFDINGAIKWSYAPRGQLAAAPTLVVGSSRRLAEVEKDDLEEQLLRPEWTKDDEYQFSVNFKPGDLVRVKPGTSFQAEGMELYRAGDKGLISGVLPAEEGKASSAVIQWTRTGHKSEVQLRDVKDHFERVESKGKAATLPSMLVGSTTSGYVFAIALDSGEELWATWASNDIAGVKGSVAGKDGIIVVATDRCTDRYCYRYRNETVPLTPGNSFVRGLNAADGSAVWEFKPMSPVWNMVPQWGPDGSVLFQDWEGRAYSLDLQTGDKRFQAGGDLGSHTNAAAVYDPGHNVLVALGMTHYSVNNYHMENALGVPVGKYCNPYPAPGILVNCFTWPGGRGFIRGYNATSGRSIWETETPEPPASASTGMLNSPGMHTRLIVTMGMNCKFNSPSQIWALDPNSGHIRWMRDGPTLWTMQCAGDKEGADIRRAMGGRAACKPNSWSAPAIDSNGDVYVGSQVGELLKFGTPPGSTPSPNNVGLLSTLTTGVAFQDSAIAFGPGVMAASTCTSLIVFQTMSGFENETWSVSHNDYSPSPHMVHGEEVSHTISEAAHDTYDPNEPAVAVPWLY